MMRSTNSLRRHELDWLRVLAFATLILYHVGMFYVAWPWHVKSDYASDLLEPALALIDPWRLGLLFFISGVALRFMMDSRGPRAVASDRVGRLLLPIGFGMLVVVMPQAYFELRAKDEIEAGLLPFLVGYLSPFTSFSIVTPSWNHLWFLVYLLAYSLVLAASHRPLTRLRARVGPCMTAALTRAPWLVIILPSIPGLLSVITLDPVFPTTHMLIDDWATHAHGITMMLFGWFAGKSSAFWGAIRASLLPAAAIALVAGMVLTVVSGDASIRHAPLSAVARPLYAWAVIALLLGLAQRFLSRPSKVLAYATQAVLPWYILHQSLIVAIGFVFIGSGLPLWVEVPAVLLGTAVGCASIYELMIRRSPWIRPLFGLARRPPVGAT